MNTLKDEERKALKFYEGDIQQKDREDPFYGDAKAYVTLNSLLFTGVETEKARTAENRTLNPAIALEEQKCRSIYEALFTACRNDEHSSFLTYRVERYIDYQQFLKEGCFTSFISTSKKGFLNAYQDKYDLVFMEIVIEKDTMCFCYDKLKEDYAKADEQEVLLPPYFSITVEELPLLESMRTIKDGRGNPPVVYCRIHIGSFIQRKNICLSEATPEEKNAVIQVYQALNHHEIVDEKRIHQYTKYKQKLQQKYIDFVKENIQKKV